MIFVQTLFGCCDVGRECVGDVGLSVGVSDVCGGRWGGEVVRGVWVEIWMVSVLEI